MPVPFSYFHLLNILISLTVLATGTSLFWVAGVMLGMPSGMEQGRASGVLVLKVEELAETHTVRQTNSVCLGGWQSTPYADEIVCIPQAT